MGGKELNGIPVEKMARIGAEKTSFGSEGLLIERKWKKGGKRHSPLLMPTGW